MASFPDLNVWLALLSTEHVQSAAARHWWEEDVSPMLAFVRLTQIGLLRLLTNASVMDGKPLTMQEAWLCYDRLFADSRVSFMPEPPQLERTFRAVASAPSASPKRWADDWLMAFAEVTGGAIITFDRALAARAPRAVLLR